MEISAEKLKEVLTYDPQTGIFTWLKTLSGRGAAGRQAGHIGSNGYVRINLFREFYYGHRLAWFYVTGCWPTEEIDHINGVRNDNRFVNLREADQTQTMQNQGVSSKNTTGRRGVFFDRGKYRVRIQSRGDRISVGNFVTLDQAITARDRAEKTVFGDFCPSHRKAWATSP